jgi:lactate dehydrogenase-like 2-hydroxyacid dehydrogenase
MRHNPSMQHRLLVAARLARDVIARARAEFEALVHEGEDDMTADQVIEAATGHHAEAIVFTHTLPLRAEVIARLPTTVRIGATSSVGYEHIDIAAARAHGLIVTNTPGVLTDCTADFTFMMLLGAARRASEYERIMREGWRRRFGQGDLLGIRVSGKRLGILGMGRIGRAMAKRARGFEMSVLYHQPRRLAPELEDGATYFPTLHEMLPHCDFLSLHAPATPETHRTIDAAALARLPRGAVEVNVARGALVDEDALYEALTTGHLFAAGLDVFRSEPDYDLRFRALPNVLLAPHMGSATVETRNAMGFRALDNIAAVLGGRGPIDPLWT